MRLFAISFVVISLTFLLAVSVLPQTTEFTYQGSLQNSSAPANGNFDFEFLLFDSLTGGVQIGSTLTRSTVAVAAGTFAVKLDFGANFPGANRFLEIHVRPTGGGAFTSLAPRQSVGSSPYSVQSLNATNATTSATATNATQLGGVAANQYVVTTDPRMTDPRPPTAGSASYIQNGTSPQGDSNFNISGDGTASGTLSGNVVNTAAEYNIGGIRAFSLGGVGNYANTNTMAGKGAGASTVPTNFGIGSFNSFYGYNAGLFNTTGGSNSFFGFNAGRLNSTGDTNSFFGDGAGEVTTGSGNSFFGTSAGGSNTTGQNNTFIGTNAGSSSQVNGSTAIGYGAIVSTSNTIVLGTSSETTKVPGTLTVGTDNLPGRLSVEGTGWGFAIAGTNTTNGGLFGSSTSGRGVFGNSSTGYGGYFDSTSGSGVYAHSTSGYGILARSENTHAIYADGSSYFNRWIVLAELRTGGTTSLCRNSSNEVALCSSSLRYKTNIAAFNSGLDFVNQLRPISFDWKDGGMKDVGFGAEDIAKIDRRFVTYNSAGEVEGVKYDRLSVAFVNAFKEQQIQIEAQRAEIEQLKKKVAEVDELKAILCAKSPKARVCKRSN